MDYDAINHCGCGLTAINLKLCIQVVNTNRWIQLKVNSNVIDMALVHSSRQSCDSEAWLMATPTLTKNHCIMIEVNRFDPGKWIKNNQQVMKLHPTLILPTDMAIHCKIINRSGINDNFGILTHNLSTLQDSYSLLDQRLHSTTLFEYHLLMSVRIIIIKNDHHTITIKAGCVLPSTLAQVHPVNNIPLFPIPLSRNLSTPNMVIQTNIRMGYLSMDKCRKLVPLLQSDNSIHSLPLVGIWLSGLAIDHPLVWSICLQYITNDTIDKVYNNNNTLLVLLPGNNSQLWQCSLINNGWEWHIGETTNQLSSITSSIELMPCNNEGSAGTLIHSSLIQWNQYHSTNNDSVPIHVPAPQPLSVPNCIAHDSDLSCISNISVSHDMSHDISRVNPSHNNNDILLEHQKQLESLKEQVRLLLNERDNTSKEVKVQTTPTNNATTNTGISLLEGISLNYESSSTLVIKTSQCSNSSGTLTLPISPPTMSSLMSTSIMSRDLYSPEYSSCYTEEPDKQELYKNLKDQINDLLGTSCCDSIPDVSNESLATNDDKEVTNNDCMSILSVPRIKYNDISELSEVTIDSCSNLADVITNQYLTDHHHHTANDNNSSNIEYSMATRNYLSKHGLIETRSNKILDIQRLRNIPKLI